jgi:hypothetical protein
MELDRDDEERRKGGGFMSQVLFFDGPPSPNIPSIGNIAPPACISVSPLPIECLVIPAPIPCMQQVNTNGKLLSRAADVRLVAS